MRPPPGMRPDEVVLFRNALTRVRGRIRGRYQRSIERRERSLMRVRCHALRQLRYACARACARAESRLVLCGIGKLLLVVKPIFFFVVLKLVSIFDTCTCACVHLKFIWRRKRANFNTKRSDFSLFSLSLSDFLSFFLSLSDFLSRQTLLRSAHLRQ